MAQEELSFSDYVALCQSGKRTREQAAKALKAFATEEKDAVLLDLLFPTREDVYSEKMDELSGVY